MLIGVLKTDQTHNAEIMARGYVIDAVALNGGVDIITKSAFANVTLVRSDDGVFWFWDNGKENDGR